MNSDRSFGSFGMANEARQAFNQALRKSQDADIGILLVSEELVGGGDQIKEVPGSKHDASTYRGEGSNTQPHSVRFQSDLSIP